MLVNFDAESPDQSSNLLIMDARQQILIAELSMNVWLVNEHHVADSLILQSVYCGIKRALPLHFSDQKGNRTGSTYFIVLVTKS